MKLTETEILAAYDLVIKHGTLRLAAKEAKMPRSTLQHRYEMAIDRYGREPLQREKKTDEYLSGLLSDIYTHGLRATARMRRMTRDTVSYWQEEAIRRGLNVYFNS